MKNKTKTLFLIITILSLGIYTIANSYNKETYAYESQENKNPNYKNSIIINFAKMIIDNLNYTHYQHDNQILDIEKKIFLTNCSGFMNFILSNTFPEALNSLEVEKEWCWSGSPRPRAAGYYQAFIDSENKTTIASNYWKKIDKFVDIIPGDIIASREDSFDGNSNSGHVMIAANYPTLISEDSAILEVIDASKYKHSNDTRIKNGVGKGTMLFYLDNFGNPIALGWTLKSKTSKARKIAIGRLNN
ncbi:MAG: hypothetical protein C5B43_02235 [Verrucomicrobia bacterium]|nr:MAG: hypothetical protein C5B43_02235 [Verrucomicrobiota bacterium]